MKEEVEEDNVKERERERERERKRERQSRCKPYYRVFKRN
jgi:hypothetical protein